MTRLQLCMAAALALLVCCDAASVLVLNDIHYLAWYSSQATPACGCMDFRAGCPAAPAPPPNANLAQMGCDPSAAFVQLAVAATRTFCPNPEFVVVLGDAAGHGTNAWAALFNKTVEQAEQQVFSMVQYVTDAVRAQYQDTPTFFSIGNDDAYPDYASPPPNSSFFRSLQDLWSFSLGHHPGANASFLQGGYYRADATASLTLLLLNTNMLSVRGGKNCSDASALAMLQWLAAELAAVRAAGRRAWVVGHIPPGVNLVSLTALWADCFARDFVQLMSQYDDVIAELLFAHQHRAVVQGLGAPMATAIRVHPAVSPIYQNNPGFRCYELGPDPAAPAGPAAFLTDYSDIYFPLNATNASFQRLFTSAAREYGLPMLAPGPYELVQRMAGSMVLFALYWGNAVLGMANDDCVGLAVGCVDSKLCTFTTITMADFVTCLAAPSPAPAPGDARRVAAIVVPVVLGGLLCAALAVWAWRQRSRQQGSALYARMLDARLADDA